MTSAVLAASATLWEQEKKKKVIAQMWFKSEKCNKNFLRTKDRKESQSVYEWRLATASVGKNTKKNS